MDDDTPIACSLSAGDLQQRKRDMAELGDTALLAVEGTSERPVLVFRGDAESRLRVEAVITAESTCCAFLSFDLQDAADGLRLTISGPADAAPMIGDLVAAFQGQPA